MCSRTLFPSPWTTSSSLFSVFFLLLPLLRWLARSPCWTYKTAPLSLRFLSACVRVQNWSWEIIYHPKWDMFERVEVCAKLLKIPHKTKTFSSLCNLIALQYYKYEFLPLDMACKLIHTKAIRAQQSSSSCSPTIVPKHSWPFSHKN